MSHTIHKQYRFSQFSAWLEVPVLLHQINTTQRRYCILQERKTVRRQF
jgi:hypothetical protein